MTLTIDRRLALAGLPALLAAPAFLRRAAAQPAPATATVPQAPGFYRFKVSSFTVTTVHDGFRDVPLQGFVKNAPLEEVKQVLAESFLTGDSFRIPFTVTFVDTGKHLVAFDTGNGVTPPGATMGRLMANMQAAGIDPAKVDTVVMSHFHGDHVNGLLNAEGGAAFPNAEIIVPATEWAWWADAGNETRSPEGQRPNFANSVKRFAPYKGRIRQAAEGAEVVPGIRGVPAYGHTPGHTCYHIADRAAEAMFVADVTNRPELTARRPDMYIIFDFDPQMAEVSRRKIFDRVSADRIRITGYHFPFPANGYIAREGNGYRFVLADWSSAV